MDRSLSVLNLLENAGGAIVGGADRALQQHGITLSQYRVLSTLEWSPRVQQRLIAELLGHTEASVSRQVRLLESAGLIETVLDVVHKRRRVLVATPKGMQVTEAANATVRDYMRETAAILPPGQFDLLVELLGKLDERIAKRQ